MTNTDTSTWERWLLAFGRACVAFLPFTPLPMWLDPQRRTGR
jgi:hypothetical protein